MNIVRMRVFVFCPAFNIDIEGILSVVVMGINFHHPASTRKNTNKEYYGTPEYYSEEIVV